VGSSAADKAMEWRGEQRREEKKRGEWGGVEGRESGVEWSGAAAVAATAVAAAAAQEEAQRESYDGSVVPGTASLPLHLHLHHDQ
jgi:hypothetical protein